MVPDISMDTKLDPKIPALWLIVLYFAILPPSLHPIFYLLLLSIIHLHSLFFLSTFVFWFFCCCCFSPFMLRQLTLPALNWYSLDHHSSKGTKAEGYYCLGQRNPMSGCPFYTLSFKEKKKKKRKEAVGTGETSPGHLVITNMKQSNYYESHKFIYHYS